MSNWLRRLPRGSIRARMTIGVAAVIALTMGLFVLDEVREDREYLIKEETSQALRLAHNFAVASGALVLTREHGVLNELAQSFRLHAELDHLMLVSLDGEVLAHSDASQVGRLLRDATSVDMLTGPREARVLRRDDERIDVAVPVHVGGRPVGWSQVGFSLVHVREGEQEALWRGLLFLAIGVAAGIVAASWSGRRLTARLRGLLLAMERVRRGDRAVRAEIRGEDEIGRLALGFNAVLDSLAESERRTALDELRLRRSEASFRSIAANVPGMVFEFLADGRDGHFSYVSGGARDLCGCPPEELIDLTDFVALLHPEDREGFKAIAIDVARTLEPLNWEGRMNIGREVKWVNVRAAVHRREDDAVWHGVVLNITESRRAADALRRSRDEVRELTRHQEAVREEEKASIAREIHDELGATLTALKMDAPWLERRVAALEPEHAAKLKEMQALVDQAVQSTRRISTELRPRVIDDLGIVAALEWLVGEFRRQRGVECRLAAAPEHIDLDTRRAITLFRIVQESLTNVAKHSGATRVSVELRQHDRAVHLRIEDNGCGIGDRAGGCEDRPFSHGLRGMIERAHQIGGSLSIGDGARGGTVVAVTIPVAAAPEWAPRAAGAPADLLGAQAR